MTILLSLLGGGGVIGALLFLVPGLRELIGKLLGSIPPRVLWAVLALAAIFALVLWHNHAVNAARSEGHKAGATESDVKWQTAFDTMHTAALDWKRAYELTGDKLADELRNAHDQTLDRNAADAADLRLRGAGKAAARCGPGSNTFMAQGPGGQGPDPAGSGAPAGPLPAENGPDQFAIVPWSWIVQQAEEHDSLLDEVKTWRAWDDAQRKAHDDAVEKLKAMQPGFGKKG